uniref:Uncharacterized protein n=1 Tax=Anopheles stephensi TaxID=30069 RepID=A0A182YM00_ANOST
MVMVWSAVTAGSRSLIARINRQWGPPKSQDAIPLNYCAWGGIRESKIGTKKYQSLDQLKQALRREWARPFRV